MNFNRALGVKVLTGLSPCFKWDDEAKIPQLAPFLALSFSSSNTSTCLSISMPGNSSSDVSLKLSTDNGEETDLQHQCGGRVESQLNWATNHVASIGGSAILHI
ncbi:hypothetical protein Pint_16477 [Pistacia integerrima]|uniref:Uncharacterized protein n=1 Tax=Pistacia integerrima TaxID=434235 RepID=A0ACC0ZEF3_9ROSI|nr:hypothetical protein Pint_16477 [Pistacia integerrima]